MRASNATLARDVAAAQHELTLIQQQAYIQQQAREYRLGRPREIPFILADDAPPLAADAPGSAAVRLGRGRRPAHADRVVAGPPVRQPRRRRGRAAACHRLTATARPLT